MNSEITKNFFGDRQLLIKTNGGSVTVSKMVGGVWVVIDTFSEDGGYVYQFGKTPTKITPTGGAVFEVSA